MRKKASFEGMVKIIDMATLEELKEQEDEYFRNRFPNLEINERDVNKL